MSHTFRMSGFTQQQKPEAFYKRPTRIKSHLWGSNKMTTSFKLMCDDVTSAMRRQRLNRIETEPQGDPGRSKCKKHDKEDGESRASVGSPDLFGSIAFPCVSGGNKKQWSMKHLRFHLQILDVSLELHEEPSCHSMSMWHIFYSAAVQCSYLCVCLEWLFP